MLPKEHAATFTSLHLKRQVFNFGTWRVPRTNWGLVYP